MSNTNKKKQQLVDRSDTTSVLSTFNKALKAGSTWSDKDEFLDVIYWMRQIVGLLLGIVWGIIPIKGLLGIILFVAVNMAVTYVYYSVFQRVDEEEYGGVSEIFKEGLMTSLATFFVTWIILYSAMHND